MNQRERVRRRPATSSPQAAPELRPLPAPYPGQAPSTGHDGDWFLASARCHNPSARRTYGDVLDRVAAHVGADQVLAAVTGEEFGQALTERWGSSAPSTWNQRRAAVGSFLAWCVRNGYPASACRPASSGNLNGAMRPGPSIGRPASGY